jgi:hypothetical protein
VAYTRAVVFVLLLIREDLDLERAVCSGVSSNLPSASSALVIFRRAIMEVKASGSMIP